MSATPRRPRPILGWREWVALPALGIDRIKAKVDTGARTSALHAYDVKTHRDASGLEVVSFSVHPFQRDAHRTVRAECPLIERRWVRSSDGKRQLRPVIRTRLRVGSAEFDIELTLTTRDLMSFRMLLGRQSVRGRFAVDPARSYLASSN
ncbi:MAG: ATP-dependent zinc protease [Acidimicrobiia bacterium]|nr:ATP-dependent zinc protease [Acidimicrobiia bacterium]